jgi:hypothetical protein
MSIQSKFDQYVAELKEVRDFLSDPKRLALVKEFLKEESAEPAPLHPTLTPIPVQQPVAQAAVVRPILAPIAPAPPKLEPPLVFRGLMTQTAYECVLNMNEPFASRGLIEKMREAGYEFCSHPEVSIHTPLKKLLETKVIEIIEEGAGRHATVYQKRMR